MRPSERINLHPATHSPSELKTKEYDVIVIGSGWAGRILAARVVKAQLTAIIVESELFGGDCPFWACVPSKALLRSPEVLDAAKGVGGARERVQENRGVDVAATFKRRDRFTMGWDDTVGLIPLVQSTDVEIVRGVGKIIGVKKVQVKPTVGEAVDLEARQAVALATGSVPIIPEIPGLKQAEPWVPRDATSSDFVPEHLLIMGGGVVGNEMATAYSSYGAKVTLVSATPEILPGFDPEAGKLVRESLETKGVTFHLGVKIVGAERLASDQVTVKLSTGKEISATELLVATGRRATLDKLGLENVGIKADGRFLLVDENLRVNDSEGNWLYAAGDINGRALLTHTSKYHGAVAANAIIAHVQNRNHGSQGKWSSRSASADQVAVPQVVFTDPMVASVGLTRTAAQVKGKKVREIIAPMASPGYNIHADTANKGWAQWLVDDEDRLVGATFVGTDAAELLHASTVGIVGEMKLNRLMLAIPSFPTLSWVYYNLMDAAGL